MSEVILRQARKLQFVKDNIEVWIREVLEENATLIEDLVIEQLKEGKDGDDIFLPNYSRNSVIKFGKPPGPIKLFDTGSFYQKVFLDVLDNAFDINDTDSKTTKLVNTYGKAILKLTEKNKQLVIDFILKPELIKKINNYIAQ